MNCIFNKTGIFFLTVTALFIFSGCSGTKKQVSRDTNKKELHAAAIIAHYRGQTILNFNNDNLKKIQFEDNISVGRTNIKYQRGLEPQARFIAEEFNDVFSHVESQTGMNFAVNPQIYLMRVQKHPQNMDIVFNSDDPNIYPIPIFAEIGQDDANSIIADDIYFPYALTHEMAETSLIYPDKKGIVKCFHQVPLLILTITYDDYTRWFREGFANYAGYVALDYLRSNPDKNLSRIWNTAFLNQTPFSSLNDVGSNLFKWEQNPKQKIKGDCYSAALGLFLLLENKFGRESIRDIINELNNYESVDGSDIKKIINEKLNIDVEQLVKDFKFTKMGIYYSQLTPVLALNKGLEQKEGFYVSAVEPNSIADKAGIDANDIIIAINDRPIRTRLDFELALYKAMELSNAQCKIWRQNEGYKEVQLNLDKPYKIPKKKIAQKTKEAKSLRSLSIVTGLVGKFE